jgi:superfamily II DNA or RNA helicase
MSDIPETYYVYCLYSELNDRNGLKKLGLTIHPPHRLRQYAIGVPLSCSEQTLLYNGLWKISATSRAELRRMEEKLHSHFAEKRDGTCEWFFVTYEEVQAFMRLPHEYSIQELSYEDVRLITTKSRQEASDPTNEALCDADDDLMAEQKKRDTKRLQERRRAAPTVEDCLFAKFIRTFLSGKTPRRIQTELWNIFQAICATPEKLSYRAIVQWPTGVGKTIATLMIIVIAAERCKRRGNFYRGLFVSPKNDIIDTITGNFARLSDFGITVFDGSHGKLSSLTIPTNTHVLISACQQALISEKGMRRLPTMTHVHYDEVHRITGEQYFQLLHQMLEKWQTEIVTGTSATPKTSSSSQHERLAQLFGDPYTILHACNVDEAVREGWIAKPCFMVSIPAKSENRDAELDAYLIAIRDGIEKKRAVGQLRGGKVISFTSESKRDVLYCIQHAKEYMPNAVIYGAIDGYRTDAAFIQDAADGTVRILFACQRFREGSDIAGLDMTCALIGTITAAYILVQICGRALRLDYLEKEGWCLLVRPSIPGTTQEDVLDSILLDVIEFLGDTTKKYGPEEIEPLTRTYVGDVHTDTTRLTVEETVKRVQAAYSRRLYERQKKAAGTITYNQLRQKVLENSITTRKEYAEKALLCELPDDPMTLTGFKSWYDLLRSSQNEMRMTLYELQKRCKDDGVTSKKNYMDRTDLPRWDDLLDGYLTDLPDPLSSHLEGELFQTGRNGRR